MWNHGNLMGSYRFNCNTWIWFQYRSCFPGRTDTAAGGRVHWHRTSAVVQRPGHRRRTDNYRATERTLVILWEHVFIIIFLKTFLSEASLKGVSLRVCVSVKTVRVCVTCMDRYLPCWGSCQEVMAPDWRTMTVHLLLQHRQEPEPKKTNRPQL